MIFSKKLLNVGHPAPQAYGDIHQIKSSVVLSRDAIDIGADKLTVELFCVCKLPRLVDKAFGNIKSDAKVRP